MSKTTHHIVIKVVVHVPLLSSEQEPDQAQDGKKTNDTADNTSRNSSNVW
jgi:hypothetical protein